MNAAVPRTGPDFDPVDRERFPVDPWRLIERAPSLDTLGRDETIFAVGNGYLGMRGNPAEGRDAHSHGTFVNGFHETWPIQHAEDAFGFATTGQTIVHAPDSKLMKVYVDDEPLLLSTADLLEYERVLDMREGVLRRDLLWRTPSGKRVRVRTARMVSFTERHLAVMTLELTMLDGDAPVVVSSQILNRQDGRDEYYVEQAAMGEGFDPRKTRHFEERVLLPRGHWHEDGRMALGYRTARSGMTIAVAADHTVETADEAEERISTEDDLGKHVVRVSATAGTTLRITKAVAYHTSRGVPVRELFDRCRRTLDRVRVQGVGHYVAEQRTFLDRAWADADIEVPGQPELQQAIRWNLFQLLQATARTDQLGIAAKGVTGSGYEGHYFWDMEAYVIPFLVHTAPDVARNALRSRVAMLPKARERATQMSQRGALFPWRTINGEEASAYYAAGTAQYHIDADIAHALTKYVDVAGDVDFLAREGVDILVETARLWADLGFWRDGRKGRRFHIHGVTGPDEYTTVVNNNLFTNVMARANFVHAADAIDRLRESDPAVHRRVARRLGLLEGEVEEWRRCAAGMAIPYDQHLQIHPQDDGFLDKELWNLSETPDDRRPLLLHYHPLVIYRFQVLKQADVVLAMFLQGERFTLDEKRRNFDYYDPITTGDSTLSAVVQSIIAAEVGYGQLALDYFYRGLFVDLGDLHGNTSDGVHIASTGGVWNALVHGFGGMRDRGGKLTFDPRLPDGWDGLTFRVRVRGTRLRIDLSADALSATAEEGPGVEITVRDDTVTVAPGAPVTVALEHQGPRHTPPPFSDHPASRIGSLPGEPTPTCPPPGGPGPDES